MRLLAIACLALGILSGQNSTPAAPTASEIMQQVAKNQDRAVADRVRYVYDEHIRVITRRTSGKLAREEITDYVVTPTTKGVEKKQVAISGRYWKKGKYLAFSGEPLPDADGLDGGLTESFRKDLTDDSSKDGLAQDLFPLTTAGQADMKFELAGTENASGREAYRILFGPKHAGDLGTAGEALIDKAELQPVQVFTRLSRRFPFFVRTMLGTDLPGFGFSTRYARADKDVWFPVSFGTEFRIRAVFFINRNISVAMENKGFRRTDAQSDVHYESEPAK